MAKDTKLDKFRKSYQFFREMEQTGKTFSIEDISNATGWNKSTIKTYRSMQFMSRTM